MAARRHNAGAAARRARLAPVWLARSRPPVEAGLTLPRAIRLAADASASPEIRAFVQRYSEKQLSARSISVSLAGCPHLTPDFLGMLDVAERTGDFMQLTRLADLYEDGFR